jgi:hypothetical protein
MGLAANLSIAACRTERLDAMMDAIITIEGETEQVLGELIMGVAYSIDSALVSCTLCDFGVSPSSSLGGFGVIWRDASGLRAEGTLSELAAAAASYDIAMVGRLLGPRDVNAVHFNEKELPGSLVRRPLECSLLEVAVGSGAVEMTKYLLEFHHARPTRETLKQSISTGNLELIKLMRERLADGELRGRVDLLQVAAEFHQEEVLAWLLRDTTVFERELLGVLTLERKLADLLVVEMTTGLILGGGVRMMCRRSGERVRR